MKPPFVPPFCANPDCVHHWHDAKDPYRDFKAFGTYPTHLYGAVPRFQCTACGRTFSVQTFQVDYWVKKRFSYKDLTQRLSSCESLRAIGRAWKVAGKADSPTERRGVPTKACLGMDPGWTARLPGRGYARGGS